MNSKETNIKTSLVITTYNQPHYLSLVLKTALSQKRLPDEIIVADDGSKIETEQVVRTLAQTSPIPFLHVWQDDAGFRLNHSRNNALAVASGDYILLVDGDCFLNPYYVSDNLFYAKSNQFVSGSRVHIHENLRNKILATQDTRVGFFTRGTSKKFNIIRSRTLSLLCSHRQPSMENCPGGSTIVWRGGMAGANLAFWKQDAVKINGFNEILSNYGGDDREFGARLELAGVVRYRMLHYGMVYHFRHERPYAKEYKDRISAESPEYLETLEKEIFRCCDQYGLTRAISAKKAPVDSKGNYFKYVF